MRPTGYVRCGSNRKTRLRLQGTRHPASVDAKLGSNGSDTLALAPQHLDAV
jgi:hypothetical protein